MKLEIKIHAGLNGDGFYATLTEEEKTILHNGYMYGYNASWYRTESKEKPYVVDILKKLISDYNLEERDVTLIKGKNVFAGTPTSQESLDKFREDYLEKCFKMDE
jgi:KaiC/GvpD/RAD55 family RecA-like ATPase